MRKGQTRHCARTNCRKVFTVQRGDDFITCPACRIFWAGGDMGVRQLLPHARERKLAGDGPLLQLAGPNEA